MASRCRSSNYAHSARICAAQRVRASTRCRQLSGRTDRAAVPANICSPLHGVVMQSDVEMEVVNEFGTEELHIRIGGSSVLLNAAEVDRLIEQLGLLRCDLSPEVDRDVSREHRYAVEIRPLWRTIAYPM